MVVLGYTRHLLNPRGKKAYNGDIVYLEVALTYKGEIEGQLIRIKTLGTNLMIADKLGPKKEVIQEDYRIMIDDIENFWLESELA